MSRLTRCLSSLALGVVLLCANAPVDAGVIPFMYNSIFGYGPAWGGYPAAGGMAPYSVGYAPGYSAGYAPTYSVGYSPAYTAGYAPGYSVGYAPDFHSGFSNTGYSAGYSGSYYDGGYSTYYGPLMEGCGCNPCGCNGCSSCGGTGCSNCESGNCSSNYAPATDSTEPTPAGTNETKELPKDDFDQQKRDYTTIPTRPTPPAGTDTTLGTGTTTPPAGTGAGWSGATDRPSTTIPEAVPNMLSPRPAPGEPGSSIPNTTIPPGGSTIPGTGRPPFPGFETTPPAGTTIPPAGTTTPPAGTSETHVAPIEPRLAGTRFSPVRGRVAIQPNSETQQVASSPSQAAPTAATVARK